MQHTYGVVVAHPRLISQYYPVSKKERKRKRKKKTKRTIHIPPVPITHVQLPRHPARRRVRVDDAEIAHQFAVVALCSLINVHSFIHEVDQSIGQTKSSKGKSDSCIYVYLMYVRDYMHVCERLTLNPLSRARRLYLGTVHVHMYVLATVRYCTHQSNKTQGTDLYKDGCGEHELVMI